MTTAPSPTQQKANSNTSRVSPKPQKFTPPHARSAPVSPAPGSSGTSSAGGTLARDTSAPSTLRNGPAPAGTQGRDTHGSADDQSRKPDHPILFQTFFKSVGSRTYAAQVKRATNGNQYLVITEGRRDKQSGEIRKMRVNIFSEDFDAFFNLLRETTRFIKDHPLPPEFQAERKKFWQNVGKKKNGPAGGSHRPRTASK